MSDIISPMLKTIRGTNALTVLVSASESKLKTKMFFCPYRRNIVLKYQGDVVSIQPGFNPELSPQFYVRPQRQEYSDNISYVFIPTRETGDSVLFWIQDQYFDTEDLRTYRCYNCQAPQLYYNDREAVDYKTKKTIKQNTNYLCDNCKESLTYMGIVKIKKLGIN